MRMAFVNLPVADKEVTKAFFAALGFSANPQFESDTTACIVIEENIFVLVHEPERWKEFLHSDPSPKGTNEFMLALSASSREECDELKANALANGGAEYAPSMDFGWMYGISFLDPDGHIWEASWMDVEAAAQSGGIPEA
jgi:predicted lactoylglutathione lyase